MSLKDADKLVKTGDLEAALSAIVQARLFDPRNPYAQAYEERVRAMINARKHDLKHASGTTDPPISPVLEKLSTLAIQEEERHLGKVEAQMASKVADPTPSVPQKKIDAPSPSSPTPTPKAAPLMDSPPSTDELRQKAIAQKIDALIARAQECRSSGDYQRALSEVSRAYLLDPKSTKIAEVERSIRREQAEKLKVEDEERGRRTKEAEERLQAEIREEAEKVQKEQRQRKQLEEESRKAAQEQKIQQYLTRARSLLQSDRTDEARNELRFVTAIDPDNTHAAGLEAEINARVEQLRQEEQHRKEQEERRRRESLVEAMRKHIENARALSRQGDHAEALRVITRAFVLDPVNTELQACEDEILKAQENDSRKAREEQDRVEHERRKQELEDLEKHREAERRRILQSESEEERERHREERVKIKKHLASAKQFADDGRFDRALAEIAAAFMINPFDEELKDVEQQILERQGQHATPDASARNEKTISGVDEHLRRAEEHRVHGEFALALDEIAKAFSLDPLDERVLALDDKVQQEFFQRQESQRVERETDSRKNQARVYADIAREHIAGGKFDKALEEVNKGLDLDGGNKEMLALHGEVTAALSRQRNAESMESILDRILRAKQHLALGRVEQALAEVDSGLASSPTNSSLVSLRQEILHMSGAGNGQEAPAQHLYLERARSLFSCGEFEAALGELATLLAIDPENDDARSLEQEIWLLQNKQTTDERLGRLRVHLRAAENLANQKMFSRALDELAKAFVIDPLNEDVLKLETTIRERETEAVRAEMNLKIR